MYALSNSRSPEYLQWLSINRWNGQLPYTLASGDGKNGNSIFPTTKTAVKTKLNKTLVGCAWMVNYKVDSKF